MVYTEIKQRTNKKYYYRVLSVREGQKITKKRIYLGVNLNKKELIKKEEKANKILMENRINKGLKKIKPKIIEVLRKNKIKKAGIFGSYARGEQKKDSDVDIIIQPTKGMGLEFVGLQFELENKIRKKVDLVTYKYLSPYIKKYILKEEIRII